MSRAKFDVRTGYPIGFFRMLAEAAKISPQYISDIRRRKRTPSAKVARQIASACRIMGVAITEIDLLYPSESKSPFFIE